MSYVRCWEVKAGNDGVLEFVGAKAQDSVELYLDSLQDLQTCSLVAKPGGELQLFVVAKGPRPAPYVAGHHVRSDRVR